MIPVSLAPCLTLVSRLPLRSPARLRQTHARLHICQPKKEKMEHTLSLGQHERQITDAPMTRTSISVRSLRTFRLKRRAYRPLAPPRTKTSLASCATLGCDGP